MVDVMPIFIWKPVSFYNRSRKDFDYRAHTLKYELLSFSLVKITKHKIIFRLFRNFLTFDFPINFLDSVYSILERFLLNTHLFYVMVSHWLTSLSTLRNAINVLF